MVTFCQSHGHNTKLSTALYHSSLVFGTGRFSQEISVFLYLQCWRRARKQLNAHLTRMGNIMNYSYKEKSVGMSPSVSDNDAFPRFRTPFFPSLFSFFFAQCFSSHKQRNVSFLIFISFMRIRSCFQNMQNIRGSQQISDNLVSADDDTISFLRSQRTISKPIPSARRPIHSNAPANQTMRTTAAAGRSSNGNYSKVSEVELLSAYIDKSYLFWIKS